MECAALFCFPWPGSNGFVFTMQAYNWDANNGSYLTIKYTLSDMLMALSFLRLFFVLQVIFSRTNYSFLYGRRICEEHGFKPSIAFVIKSFLVDSPLVTVVVLTLTIICTFAYVIRILERPYYYALYQHQGIGNVEMDIFANYFNAVWMVCITLTTVGYGDIYPFTFMGRIMTIVLAFLGALLVSVFVATLSTFLELQPHEQIVIEKVKN